MKVIGKIISGILGFFARIAVSFGKIFNKDDVAANPAGRGTGNEARPRKRLVDGVDADRFTRLCAVMVIGFVSVLGAVLIAASLRSGSHRIPVDEPEQDSKPSGSFTITLGGNVMPTQDMLDAAFADDKYDFLNGMSELSEALQGDVTVVGLCGQINAYGDNKQIGGLDAGRNYPTALASALSELGVNYIFGANQHALANGYAGMCATISALHARSLGVIGMTDGEPDKLNARIVKVNGVNVGIAGFNCIEGGEYAGLTAEQKGHIANSTKAALADRAVTDIAKLKKNGAEFIAVCVNWGGLGSFVETDFMKETAKKIAESGANVIVGYGPCVTLGAEIISCKGGDGQSSRECFVFYSLGCVYGNNVFPGRPEIMNMKGDLTDAQKAALENEKKLIALSKTAMARSMTVSLNVSRRSDGTVSVTQASYNPIFIIRNIGQGEENTHMKYMSVPCVKYVSAEERPVIFADDKQWQACKSAFKAISAIADKTGGRLMLNDMGHQTEESDVSDGKI